MQLGLYFDQNRCTGCYTCIVACKDWHDVPAGPSSWIRVKTIERGDYPELFVAFLPMTCFHCQSPACLESCPTRAISKRPDSGVVVVNQEECLGAECGLCKDVCPYGAPQFRSDNAKMEKCDFCAERWAEGRKPVCVDGCPVGALDAGPLDELRTRYGSHQEAEGFTYYPGSAPSVLFKPRCDTRGLRLTREKIAPMAAK